MCCFSWTRAFVLEESVLSALFFSFWFKSWNLETWRDYYSGQGDLKLWGWRCSVVNVLLFWHFSQVLLPNLFQVHLWHDKHLEAFWSRNCCNSNAWAIPEQAGKYVNLFPCNNFMCQSTLVIGTFTDKHFLFYGALHGMSFWQYQ